LIRKSSLKIVSISAAIGISLTLVVTLLSNQTAPSPYNPKVTSYSNIQNATTTSSLTRPKSNGNVSSDGRGATTKVAFVRPSFTYAAYQLNGFYNFYAKHEHVLASTNVTTDLNLLTVKIPSGPVLIYTQNPGDTPAPIREKEYIDKLIELVKSNVPDVQIADITDKEVDSGLIFSQNGSNAYNVLFLFHQEYVTPSEYHNLEKFVQNGGVIVFNDANILTTEVRYDKNNNTVTLVEGHTWKYNGQSAWRAESEKWANETREWVGSNFLQDPTKDNVTFANNPFGYKHTEEQYATNPSDKIILDFLAQVNNARESAENGGAGAHPTVAIYELDQGKGKVISLSIFSYKLVGNPSFLDYYKTEIIPRAFSSLGQI